MGPPGSGGREGAGRPGPRRMGRLGREGRARACAAGALVALLLGGYVLRTIDRNWDWEDEERLFRAAYKVRRATPGGPLQAPIRPPAGLLCTALLTITACTVMMMIAPWLKNGGYCQ